MDNFLNKCLIYGQTSAALVSMRDFFINITNRTVILENGTKQGVKLKKIKPKMKQKPNETSQVTYVTQVPRGNEMLRQMLWESLQRDNALINVCNQTNGWARCHGQGDVETRKHKSMCGGTGVSF